MSVKAMAWVWDQEIQRDEKFVLLAYADHADHDGNNIYPAVDTVAKKTGYSRRSIQTITKRLIEHKLLIPVGTSNLQTNKYSIPMGGGAEISPPTDGGAENDIKGVQNLHGGVQKTTQGGAVATAPEPSLTHQLKSLNKVVVVEKQRPNIYTIFENEIGTLSPIISDFLDDIENTYPDGWFEMAVKEAKLSSTRVTLKYVEKILARWKAEGLPNKLQNNMKPKKYEPIWRTIYHPDGTEEKVLA